MNPRSSWVAACSYGAFIGGVLGFGAGLCYSIDFAIKESVIGAVVTGVCIALMLMMADGIGHLAKTKMPGAVIFVLALALLGMACFLINRLILLFIDILPRVLSLNR